MKITIVGIGYVGLSLAKVLARNHDVLCYDIDIEKLKKIDLVSIENNEVQYFNDLHISKALNLESAYQNAELIFLCVPTNFDENSKSLDMSCLQNALDSVLQYNKNAKVIIKSTISMESIEMIKKYDNQLSIFYSPEFLKENTALHDTLFPSRIVLGYVNECDKKVANGLGEFLKNSTELKDVPSIIVPIEEAIAIKLFSNAYLAMRISFFNELDSFARFYDLDASNIIDGVSLDPRIGDYYNHPSFGFKGYCLPKDTISLVKSFSKIPCALIPSILEANKKRLDYVIRDIIKIVNKRKCKIVGIYRITMEKNAQSIRFSIMEDIIETLIRQRINVCVYEPLIGNKEFLGVKVVSLKELFDCDLIITNRFYDDLESVREKVFSCDSFALKK